MVRTPRCEPFARGVGATAPSGFPALRMALFYLQRIVKNGANGS